MSQRTLKTPRPLSIIKQPSRKETPAKTDFLAGLTRAISSPTKISPTDVLRMQRAYGNRAVSRMLSGANIQAKLTVGAAHDAHEQEADQVANQVMSVAPEQSFSVQFTTGVEGAESQPAPIERVDENEEVQANGTLGNSFEASADVEGSIADSKGSGSPLPSEAREFMEARFGADFRQVRVHSDSEAARLNRQVSAQAFTHSQDIFIAEGKYNPASTEGKRLLAHELTHVIQQSGGAIQPLRKPKAGPDAVWIRNSDVQSGRGQIQRVIGDAGQVGDEVFDLIRNKKYKIEKVNSEQGTYDLDNKGPTIGFYSPDYSFSSPETSTVERGVALNKKALVDLCFPPFGTIIKSDEAPFKNANGKDETKFEYHFNLYMKEAVRAGISDALLEYIGSIMLKVVNEEKLRNLKEASAAKKIIKQADKLQFKNGDVQWTVPDTGYQAEILQLLHDHTMKTMTEEMGTKIMGLTIRVSPTKELGLGFHGTGRSPDTVINVHKGTKPGITLPGKLASFPDVSPFKKMDPAKIPALFRLGQKDNELYTTVSVATNFEASTDFPLLHTTPEGKENEWGVKWKGKDGKFHSLTTVFIVGVEKGYDTNAIQAMMNENKVGAHGEKATGAIALGNHYGYVTYERLHEGDTREDGHTFRPLAVENLVAVGDNPGLFARVQTILAQMNVSKFHRGG